MKENIKCYLKIFLIPTFLFIIIMVIDSDSVKDFFDTFIGMIIIIFIWFLIALPITLIYLKLRNLQIIKFFSENFVYLCAILNFLTFIYFRSIFIIEDIFKSVIITILFFIPTMFSLILIYLNRKQILKLKKINLIQILLIFSSILYIFIVLTSTIFIMASDGVNNSINYWRVRNFYFKKKFEFPNKIPKGVRNIIFHYHPSFLQGSEVFSLYYESNDSLIQNYKKDIKKISKNNGEFNFIKNKYYLDDNFLEYTKKEDISAFNIYYLDGFCDNSSYCNHGEYKIIGIDESSNAVIFFYKKW